MVDKVRVKKFSNIDDVLQSPGTAMIYMEELRTQIYHLQKKMRKRNRQLVDNNIAIAASAAGLDYIANNLDRQTNEAVLDAVGRKMLAMSKAHMKGVDDVPLEFVKAIIRGE